MENPIKIFLFHVPTLAQQTVKTIQNARCRRGIKIFIEKKKKGIGGTMKEPERK